MVIKMKELPKVQTNPKADDSAVIAGECFRITVLTERLFRLEYSTGGCFEDRATQVVWNRNFAPCDYRICEEKDQIEITTEYLSLVYNKQEFSENGLTIEIKGMGPVHKWHYKKTACQGGNFGGTTRTLDDVDGACEIEPGLVSREGWAVLDDSGSLLLEESGWIIPREKEVTDLYFFGYGQDYPGCLKDYHHLTGKTPMLPRFALGNWWSRYYEYTQDSYKALMERFDEEGIPFSVAVIDMDWHLVHIDPKYGDGWTGFTWNTDFFPDPEGFLSWLHERGMRITLNLHPAQGIHAHEKCYQEAAKEMGVDIAAEKPIEFDVTDPKFMKTYFKYGCYPHEKIGVDFWWIDWQQGSKTKLAALDPLWMLNHFHFLDSAKHGKRPITFSRYAGPGSHRYPVGFSGDTHVTWASLDFQPYFTASASNIGYGWWSHDIGGHTNGIKDDELEGRWYQYGVFSPIMRLHSTKNEFNGKEPWRFRKDIAETMKDFLRLRHKLLPYLYTMNYRAYQNDEPIVEPLYYRHGWQKIFEQVKNEYYFGQDFIVSPITQKQHPKLQVARAATWLPEGTFVDFFTGVIYTGGRKLDMYRDISSIPVFVKLGTIIPMTEQIGAQAVCHNPERIYLRVFAGADGTFSLYEDDNESINYLEGECVFTDYSILWREGLHTVDRVEDHRETNLKCFKVSPARGNKSLIPVKRSYVIELNAVELKNDAWRETTAIVNGESCPVVTAYDKEKGILTVEIPPTNIEAEICIHFPGSGQLRKNCVKDLVFHFLDRAEMEFDQKARLYETICNEPDKLKLLAELQSMKLEAELLGALTELITAQI